MAKIDLSKLSLDELKAHAKEVQQAIADFDKKKRAEALAAIEELAAKHGFKASELFGGTPAKATRAKSPSVAKYRHPENPSITWTGRGRKPGWISDALAKGKKLLDFSI